MPSTEPDDHADDHADAYTMPLGMYEFLTGGPISDPPPPGFTLHDAGDVPLVRWEGSFHAPETAPEPETETPVTETFTLRRDEDITGISGVGIVADGARFPDGTTVLRWRDLGGQAAARGVQPTTVVFPSLAAVEALHGHNGSTRIIFDDDIIDGARP